MSQQSILEPALKAKYGKEWYPHFLELCKGLSIKEATEKINKELDIEVQKSIVYQYAKVLGAEIRLEKRGRPASLNPKVPKEKTLDPITGLPKKRGRASTILPLLLSHFETEEKLKAAFEQFSGSKIKEIAYEMNKIMKKANPAFNDIEVYNYGNLIQKYGIELSCKRVRKAKVEVSGVEGSSTPVGVEKSPVGPAIKVRFACQNPKCKHIFGQILDLGLGLGLRGRKCFQCGEFGTYKASYPNPENGNMINISLKPNEDGILDEVIEIETPLVVA